MKAPPGGGGGQGVTIYVDGFTIGRLPPARKHYANPHQPKSFSAESSTPGMGRVDIVTKPGNDRWRGTFGFNLRNSALDARNAFALNKPNLDQNRYQFNFGGPLIHKKLSFLVNAERRSLTGFNTVSAITLDRRLPLMSKRLTAARLWAFVQIICSTIKR
ncbi:MAG: hypothetical protein U0Y68_25255 [Blastocatellia bacterium]